MRNLVSELKLLGVKRVISCPGGRNQPLLDIFETSNDFKVETFFDERSASFYALGLATKNEPVVVVTTSGSAVAECLPAVIEAKYQNNLPLIILSADRPAKLRYTGAPQTIPQQNIFSDFAESVLDIQSLDKKISLASIKYPAHINVCIEETNPIAKKVSTLNFDQILILSQMKETDKNEVLNLLSTYEGFIVLEALSNFNTDNFPKAQVIRLTDLFFEKVNISTFKKIIRIGSVPVLKVWREIDVHESYYLKGYLPGSMNSKELDFADMKDLVSTNLDSGDFSKISDINNEINLKISALKESLPKSEISLVSDIMDLIPEGSPVFIGNSLPIREVQYSNLDRNIDLIGQRGVNGIDGSLSFALGATDEANEVWIVLGDLTLMYDLQGFWALRNGEDKKIRIVVINNSGGQIFKKIFNKDYMLNSHNMNFSSLAEQWDLDYINKIPDSKKLKSDRILIELKPDALQSEAFWKEQSE